MRAFLAAYARTVGALGLALLIAALATDRAWMHHGLPILVLFAAVAILRLQQIPLTKYGALNMLAVPALAGSLIAGAPTAALGMWLGVAFADGVLLRKGVQAALINAGREVVALIAAYGIYAWGVVALSGDQTSLNTETLPALAMFALAYFLVSRLLLYFTLLLRDKLVDEEKSLILRYEVIAFGAGAIAVAVILLTVANIRPIGWAVVGVVMLGAGLLVKKILEESIAAEELNKILAMEQVVSSDVDIADAFRRIQLLAHRLVDWQRFRIARVDDGVVRVVWDGDDGYLAEPKTPDDTLGQLREEALKHGDAVSVRDSQRDQRRIWPCAASSWCPCASVIARSGCSSWSITSRTPTRPRRSR
jgi:hypothetical protein